MRYAEGTTDSTHGYVGSLGHTIEPGLGDLIYMAARYYDPYLGRFISEDPARDGENWFTYVANNPINLNDVSGKLLSTMLAFLLSEASELKEHATALAVKRWGEDKIQSAVAYYSGEIMAYLALAEFGDAMCGYTEVGVFIKNSRTGA